MWLMIMFFAMAVGASLGVYTMLPLYLVTERGFDQGWANLLVALSRLPGLAMAFAAGWAHDRFGARASLIAVFAATGLTTMTLGMAQGGLLVAAILVQPAVSVGFFPVGFATLSRVAPPHLRGVAVSLVTPLAVVMGGGLLPAFIGWMGEHYSFGWGVAASGLFFLAGAGLALFLRPVVERPAP
jgi:NNP family nitrate/nitrite transporter-like MFS transporter